MKFIFARALTVPLATVYYCATRFRNLLYDKNIFPVHRVKKSVVSVGNLTVGGTGKTPFTDFLIRLAKQRGLRPVVLSRGYGGKTKGVARIPSEGKKSELASKFGDEPTWLALRHPDVPVYIGVNKVLACEKILKNETFDFILADDAFQHRRLGRNLEIVVLDASEDLSQYFPMPLGRAREGFSSLRRVDVVVLNKSNLSSTEKLQRLSKRLDQLFSASQKKPLVVRLNYRIRHFLNIKTGEKRTAESLKGSKVMLVSAIARPQSFEKLIQHEVQAVVLEHLKFRDHCLFGESEYIKIKRLKASCAAEMILVTEKDSVKLDLETDLMQSIWVSELEVEAESPLDELYEILARSIY